MALAANSGSGPTEFYEEIEPFCRWQRFEEIDILEVHLPQGSKKQHLKIQVNNLGILTITGECPVEQTKTVRFRKELKVAKTCKRNEIRAKFSRGILHVTMPKSNPQAHTESLKARISQTLSLKPNGSSKPAEETSTSRGSSQFYSRFSTLRQRLWNKTAVEGVAAAVVAAVAIFGVVKAYEYFTASPL
ncbi:PREDICTED: inactive protein RESTRICTED TEV MOVEMENT 2-like [Tarenaya hassleriana]|uniref:inactive protein RESTRICTED TEV MOVEMENT 2-like n=1 Tax=Tarenaya hassleriana TaxID=28532 RepID=UPI00053C9844|nr:PREDICTED: inactive protein RESTRICTED TEV MOVEMENT 2-like [Tarenaya hassleriana]